MWWTFNLHLSWLSKRVAVATCLLNWEEAFSLLQSMWLPILDYWLNVARRHERISVWWKLATCIWKTSRRHNSWMVKQTLGAAQDCRLNLTFIGIACSLDNLKWVHFLRYLIRSGSIHVKHWLRWLSVLIHQKRLVLVYLRCKSMGLLWHSKRLWTLNCLLREVFELWYMLTW